MLAACGGEPEAPPTPTLSPQLQVGSDTFTGNCAICHALTPETIIRGPSLHNIANTAATRVDGLSAEAYINQSILQPSDYLVDGFEDIMLTSLAKDLTGEELDAVVAYLLTFDSVDQ